MTDAFCPLDSVASGEPGLAPGSSEVFISYARKDDAPRQSGDTRGMVTALYDAILEDHREFSTEPLRIFFDTSSIECMDERGRNAPEALRHSHILLVCVSPDYFRSDFCRREFEEYMRWRDRSRMKGEDSGIVAVYLSDVFGDDEELSARSVSEWREEIFRNTSRGAGTRLDLRRWFAEGERAFEDEAVQERIKALGLSLWQRIQKARRPGRTPGNLCRMNPHYVGRRAELRQLHEKLASGDVYAATVVHGQGGQGKTELTVAYANESASSYGGGVWVLDAEGRDAMLPLIGELASVPEFGLPAGADWEETPEQRGRRVLTELKRRAHAARAGDSEGEAACLLLLDYVSEPALLAEPQIARLPRESWLRVVASTRIAEDELAASGGKSLAFVSVGRLGEDDAAALLRNHQPGLRWGCDEDEAAARSIARELGGFTQAVESVAIHLGLNPKIRPADCLERLKGEGLPDEAAPGVHAPDSEDMEHRRRQLSIVFDVALENLDRYADRNADDDVFGCIAPQDDTPLRTALEFASLFPPDGIPWPWLRYLVEREHSDALRHEEGRSDPWLTVRRRLEGLRFIIPGPHPEMGRMNRLLGAHLRAGMGRDEETRKLDAARDCLAAVGWLLEKTADDENTRLWMLRPLQASLLHLDLGTADERIASAAAVAGRLETEHGLLDRACRFLKLAESYHRALHERRPDDEDAARSLSVTLNDLGDFYLVRGRSGDAEEALRCFQDDLEISLQLLDSNPDSVQAARDVCVSLDKLGDFYMVRGRPGDSGKALRCFRRALDLSQGILKTYPNSEQASRDVSVLLNRLGDYYLIRGRENDVVKAEQCFRKVLDLAREFSEEHPNSGEVARELAMSLHKFGDFYLVRGWPGDEEAARKCFQESLEIRRELLEDTPDSPQACREAVVSLEKLGDLYLGWGRSGDAEQALRYFEGALAVRQELFEKNPNSAEAAREMSVTLNKLGDFLIGRGGPDDVDEALKYFQKCMETRRRLWAANPNSAQAARDMCVSLEKLGDCYLGRDRSGDAEEALKCFYESLKTLQQLWEANPDSAYYARSVSVTHWKLGQIAEKTKKKDLAAVHLGQCHAILHALHQAGCRFDPAMRRVYEFLGGTHGFGHDLGKPGR